MITTGVAFLLHTAMILLPAKLESQGCTACRVVGLQLCKIAWVVTVGVERIYVSYLRKLLREFGRWRGWTSRIVKGRLLVDLLGLCRGEVWGGNVNLGELDIVSV